MAPAKSKPVRGAIDGHVRGSRDRRLAGHDVHRFGAKHSVLCRLGEVGAVAGSRFLIEVLGVSKRFGRRVALAEVTFTAPAGMITGLIGPNGAGKTTLLRILAGLLSPDSGTVAVSGSNALQPAARRQVGVLTEAQGLYARLTVREHIHYAGGLHGMYGAPLRRRSDELISLLDLDALAEERTAGFSRGQQTRVSLARALVHSPSILLLDEPTSTLDIPSARRVRAVLRHLRDEGA